MFVARIGLLIERDLISKEISGSQIDLEKIQKSSEEEPIVCTSNQPEVVQPIKQTDISPVPLHIFNRVCLPHEFYGFSITIEGDVYIVEYG